MSHACNSLHTVSAPLDEWLSCLCSINTLAVCALRVGVILSVEAVHLFFTIYQCLCFCETQQNVPLPCTGLIAAHLL